MKRFFFTIVALVIAGAVALAAYPMVSPYHQRLRNDFKDPAKRQQAIQQAIDFEKTHYKAIMGDAEAQYKFALAFSSGELGWKDSIQAMKWLRRAADKGIPAAQFAMAHAYFAGEIVAKDEIEGANWTAKAAQAGVAQANDLLGLLYAGGIGEQQDLMEGLGRIKKSQVGGIAQIGADIDEKLKAVYALPKEQHEEELKKVATEAKTEVQERFPELERSLAEQVLGPLAAPPAK